MWTLGSSWHTRRAWERHAAEKSGRNSRNKAQAKNTEDNVGGGDHLAGAEVRAALDLLADLETRESGTTSYAHAAPISMQ